MRPSDTAEAYVIGAILLDPAVMDDVAAVVKPDMFLHPSLQRIYRAMLSLWEAGTVVEPVAVQTRLEADDISVMEEVLAAQPHTSAADHYAKQLVTEHHRRESTRIFRRAMDGIGDRTKDPMEVVEETATALHSLSVPGKEVAYGCGGGLAKMFNDLEDRHGQGGGIVGIPTPFPKLDKTMCGWEDSIMYVLAARPSVGKSAMALQAALSAAEEGRRVLWVGLEGTEEQWFRRCLASASGISVPRLKRAEIGTGEWPGLTRCMAELQPKLDNICTLFEPGVTPMRLRAEAMKAKRRFGLDFIVFDHLHLAKSDGGESREYERVSSLSSALNDIAMEMKVPLLALAQLNREAGRPVSRGSASKVLTEDELEMREPRLIELRGSGTIEQDAAVVLLLHRPTLKSRVGRLIMAKQRDGEPEVAIDLEFDPDRVTFKEQ